MKLKNLVPKLPDMKIRMREGSIRSLLRWEATPMSEVEVTAKALMGKKDTYFKGLKTRKMKTYNLNAMEKEAGSCFKLKMPRWVKIAGGKR